MKTAANILVVDDEHYTQIFFKEILSKAGYAVETADHGKEAIKKFQDKSYDLVLLDLKMPELGGEKTLEYLRKRKQKTPVIIITAYGSKINFDKMLKAGANDFFTKPFVDIDSILSKISSTLLNKRICLENIEYEKNISDKENPLASIKGNSPKLKHAIHLAQKVASSFANILIEGESGTGKELFAKAIHQLSPIKTKPFMPINCGGIPDNLLESILFGYEKGAFTNAYKSTRGIFEVIDGGTLFLDEIGETSIPFQIKLLRVLQNREFMRLGATETKSTDFRLIAATNKDLEVEIKEGNFRKDLYYRINVVRLQLPPLREMKEDISILLDFFLDKFCKILGVKKKTFTRAAHDVLCNYDWEGNIRELENFIESIVILNKEKNLIEVNDISEKIRYRKKEENPKIQIDSWSKLFDNTFNVAKLTFEKEYIASLLQRTRGDLQIASQIADINLATLYRKINKYNLKSKSSGF